MANAKVKVTVKLPTLDSLREKINSTRNQALMGNFVVAEMKDFIDKGVSPVKGEGKFVPYSSQRLKSLANKRIKSLKVSVKSVNAVQSTKDALVGYKRLRKDTTKKLYPYNVQDKYPDKKASPVNLNLSGKMLEALKYLPTPKGISVGVFDSLQTKKAAENNNGNPDKRLPRRHFIPSTKNDEFVISIQRGIKDLFVDIIDSIIRNSK